jgi:hypothetical protein
MQCGWIMTKLVQCHSVWTSYRASYPTLLIYDEFWMLLWMHRDLWRNLWRNWHNVMVFGLHIGLHIQHCESMTKSDSSSWMQCDLWRNLKTSCEYRHGSQGFFSELIQWLWSCLIMWLSREATTSFSLLALSPPHHQKSYVALHETTYGTVDV